MRILCFDSTPEASVTSLRKRHKGMWARIRDRRFKDQSFLCDICRSDRGRRDWLDAHEVYSFPQPGVIRLERIVFICKHCHEAIHLERTSRNVGEKWLEEVKSHYCAVNDVTREELEADYRQAMKRTNELRNIYTGKNPRMDYGEYQAEADLCESRKRREPNNEVDEDEMYPDHECPWDVGHAD